MTKEMPKNNNLSLEMMYQTAGTQINLDYSNEKNFTNIFKISSYIIPLSIAIFANSSISCGILLNIIIKTSLFSRSHTLFKTLRKSANFFTKNLEPFLKFDEITLKIAKIVQNGCVIISYME